MSIDVTLLIAFVSICITVSSFIVATSRNAKKDTTEEVEERASLNARVLTKLDSISDDLRDIKKDNQDMRKDISSISDRVLILEQRVDFADKVSFGSGYAEKTE